MRSAELVRDRFVERLNDAVRRPGLWTPLIFEDQFFEGLLGDLAFIDGSEADLQAAVFEVVDARGLRSSIGTRGPLGKLLPERYLSSAIAALWAEIAGRLGWLSHDPVPSAVWESGRAALEAAVREDLRGRDVRDLIAVPSVEARAWMALVAADGRWLVAHVDPWEPRLGAESQGGFVSFDEARVVGISFPAASFADGLRLTPHGRGAP